MLEYADNTVFDLSKDGEDWSIKVDVTTRRQRSSAYAFHASCGYSVHDSDEYANIWSWLEDDLIEDESTGALKVLPESCHYCEKRVPKEIVALIVLYNAAYEVV